LQLFRVFTTGLGKVWPPTATSARYLRYFTHQITRVDPARNQIRRYLGRKRDLAAVNRTDDNGDRTELLRGTIRKVGYRLRISAL